jgi:Fur family ferric uptake transcriptional regulator
MKTKSLDEKLQAHNLRKTAMRQDILSIFTDAKGIALANKDIEDKLDTFDRITLYRTLKAFEKNGLIHQVIDGTGTTKYALCSDYCDEHHHHDVHAHFYCTSCEQTSCLENVKVSEPVLDKGFKIESAQLVLNGICNECH